MSDESQESENSSSESDWQNALSQEQSTAAAEHSYLPGTSNPLFPASLVRQRRRQSHGTSTRRTTGDSFSQLAILILEGVVVLPGSTLPLRLASSQWITYLGRKIEESRGLPNEEVRIGIITILNEPPPPRRIQRQRDRSSWMRRAFTSGSGEGPIQALIVLDESDTEDSESELPMEALVVPDDESGTDANESDSDASAHSAVPDVDVPDVDVQEEKDEGNAAQLQEVDLLRFAEQRLEEIEESLDAAEELVATLQWTQQLEDAERRNMMDIPRQISEAQVKLSDALIQLSFESREILRRGQVDDVLRLRGRVRRQKERMDACDFLFRRIQQTTAQRATRDPLIGRVGTVATISYTFDDTSDNVDEYRNEQREQLVVTVLGTYVLLLQRKMSWHDDIWLN